MRDGAGIYFDGKTSARHSVSIELAEDLLRLRDPDGMVIDEWPYGDVEQIAAPPAVLRLGLLRQPLLKRLEVRDLELAAAIDERALTVDRTGAIDRRLRQRVIVGSLMATLVLVAVAVFIVPSIAERLTPLVPVGLERRIGVAVDHQVRGTLDSRDLGERLACGTAPAEQDGRAALDAMVARLAAAAALPMPVRVSVIRRPEPNAFALPGGHIYVFEGLLDKLEQPDELAGVIAHEMGHVAHRDGLRAMMQGAGLSLLFGMLLGDFVGGGAVVIASKTLIQSHYSRRVESTADAYAVALVGRVGGAPNALATVLSRIDRNRRPGMQIWLDHPQVQDRVRAIHRLASAPAGTALLDPAQWSALRRICAGA